MKVRFEATTPDGLGGLITLPASGGSSLLQSVPFGNYAIYGDFGMSLGDKVDQGAANLYGLFEFLALALVKLGISLTWWANRLGSLQGLGSSVGGLVSTGSSTLAAWVLPSALAIGGIDAFRRHTGGEDGWGEIFKITAAAILALSIVAGAGGPIASGLDTTRRALATGVANATADSLPTSTTPFEWPGTNLQGKTAEETMNLHTGDAMWRVYAMVPWCQVQFGSLAACKEYGPHWLTLDTKEERKAYVDKDIVAAEGGSEAPTVEYLRGHSPGMRLAASLAALVTAVFLVVIAASTPMVALLAWTTALLLLMGAVLWLALTMVPVTRPIGLEMIKLILGLTALSGLALFFLTGGLIVSAGAIALTATYGWLIQSIVGLAALGSVLKARSMTERVLLGSNFSGGGFAKAMGFMAMSAMLRHRRRGRSKKGDLKPLPRPGRRPVNAGAANFTPSQARPPRRLAIEGGGPRALPGGGGRPPLAPSPVPLGPRGGGGGGRPVAAARPLPISGRDGNNEVIQGVVFDSSLRGPQYQRAGAPRPAINPRYAAPDGAAVYPRSASGRRAGTAVLERPQSAAGAARQRVSASKETMLKDSGTLPRVHASGGSPDPQVPGKPRLARVMGSGGVAGDGRFVASPQRGGSEKPPAASGRTVSPAAQRTPDPAPASHTGSRPATPRRAASKKPAASGRTVSPTAQRTPDPAPASHTGSRPAATQRATGNASGSRADGKASTQTPTARPHPAASTGSASSRAKPPPVGRGTRQPQAPAQSTSRRQRSVPAKADKPSASVQPAPGPQRRGDEVPPKPVPRASRAGELPRKSRTTSQPAAAPEATSSRLIRSLRPTRGRHQ